MQIVCEINFGIPNALSDEFEIERYMYKLFLTSWVELMCHLMNSLTIKFDFEQPCSRYVFKAVNLCEQAT